MPFSRLSPKTWFMKGLIYCNHFRDEQSVGKTNQTFFFFLINHLVSTVAEIPRLIYV